MSRTAKGKAAKVRRRKDAYERLLSHIQKHHGSNIIKTGHEFEIQDLKRKLNVSK